MNTAASQTVLFAASEFLRRHAPFDRMEGAALFFLVERLKLAYYAKDTQIISPATGIVDTLRILQRGKVQAFQSANFGGDLGVDFGGNASANPSAPDCSTTLVIGEIFQSAHLAHNVRRPVFRSRSTTFFATNCRCRIFSN